MALIKFEDYPSTKTPINANNLNNNFGELETNQKKLGKLLWSGSFTDGTITVPGLSNYIMIACVVDTVLCIGNASYGIGGYNEYGSTKSLIRTYRFSVNGENLTIDSGNTGGTEQGNLPVTEIYGII